MRTIATTTGYLLVAAALLVGLFSLGHTQTADAAPAMPALSVTMNLTGEGGSATTGLPLGDVVGSGGNIG